jgi:hypothetical protein
MSVKWEGGDVVVVRHSDDRLLNVGLSVVASGQLFLDNDEFAVIV